MGARLGSDQEKSRSHRSSVSFSGGESGNESQSSDRERVGSDQRSRRSSVSFSGGESGNESSEEFRNLRRQHYAAEWKQQDHSAGANVSNLETNTNTNLNRSTNLPVTAADPTYAKNPMEGGRP